MPVFGGWISSVFCSDSCETFGKQIDDWQGNEQYDAATKNWGKGWETPTDDQISELVNNCSFTWTVLKNSKGEAVEGVTVTGPNGNYIFLPAAGCRDGTYFRSQGAVGYYWSSSPHESGTGSACNLRFYSGYRDLGNFGRNDAFPVRPVSAQ